MKLAYQVSTPDVAPSPAVTAYQADLKESFRRLKDIGYNGAELMVANPARIDSDQVVKAAETNGLEVPMVCTGEVFGQDRVSFSDPDDAVRNEAIARAKAAIDLAALFGAQINIGRLRGGLVPGIPPEESKQRIADAFATVLDHADAKAVTVALEPVNSLAINYINTTQDGVAMVKKVDRDHFRLMLDSNHMWIDDVDMDQSITDARDVVTYVHLVDSNRKYPGNCKIDFARFIGTLHSNGYDGWLSVEVYQVPDQDTALRKSYEHIRPIVDALS